MDCTVPPKEAAQATSLAPWSSSNTDCTGLTTTRGVHRPGCSQSLRADFTATGTLMTGGGGSERRCCIDSRYALFAAENSLIQSPSRHRRFWRPCTHRRLVTSARFRSVSALHSDSLQHRRRRPCWHMALPPPLATQTGSRQ